MGACVVLVPKKSRPKMSSLFLLATSFFWPGPMIALLLSTFFYFLVLSLIKVFIVEFFFDG
jgi:hypothetical protein